MADPYHNIISLRAVRHIDPAPIPDNILRHILQAGRWTGSAKNTQPWHFVVVRERGTLDALAGCGRYASHLRAAPLAVAIVTASTRFWDTFDAGRAAQSMMLTAWAEGIGSCIAGLDAACARPVLGVPDDHHLQLAISFGYPQANAPHTIEGRPLDEVLAGLGRVPFDEIVHWERW